VAKGYRPSTALYRQGLVLALTIASSGCHEDRTLGEIVEADPARLCGEASCAGWCERPPGACDAPTVRAICRPSVSAEERNTRLRMCVSDPAMLAPVCGCDGRTFRNECHRLIEQVSLFRTGECSALACATDTDCAAGEFCESAEGVCGSRGTCQPGGPGATALRCNPDSPAVCGCDRKTYRNECERRQAGISKWRDPDPPCPF
jgi:hypothetical protein